MPIRCASFDEFLRTSRRTPELVDDDAENNEADQQVNEVDSGEEEVVHKEAVAVQAISVVSQPDPLATTLRNVNTRAKAPVIKTSLRAARYALARADWTHRATSRELNSKT